MSVSQIDVAAFLGGADIYLIDQFMRKRIAPGMKVLDAGAGGGRNTLFSLRIGCDVQACDHNPEALGALKKRVAEAGDLPGKLLGTDQLEIEAMAYAAGSFDFVISNAVLHFARDEAHFAQQMQAMWTVLKTGGTFFARVSTSDGIMDALTPLGAGRYRLPTGQEWFLTSVSALKDMSEALCGELIDPVKSSLVDGQRTMTTWVMKKQ